MTAPKQEKWLYTHKDELNFTTASCIGAVFDFYAGTVERPSQFWIDMHLEWFDDLSKNQKNVETKFCKYTTIFDRYVFV